MREKFYWVTPSQPIPIREWYRPASCSLCKVILTSNILIALLIQRFVGTINDALEPLDRPVDERTLETVNKGIRQFDAWLEEWDRIMGLILSLISSNSL